MDQGLSLPSRKRGLKFALVLYDYERYKVASFAEAWIEMLTKYHAVTNNDSRFLRGSVD